MASKQTIPYLSEETLAGLDITTREVVESIEKLIAGCQSKSV